MNNLKRRDNKGRLLQNGEMQLPDGRYVFRYTDFSGKRQQLSSWKLTNSDPNPPRKMVKASLREQEKELAKLNNSGIYSDGTTVLELVDRYISTKVNVTHNTKAGYKTVHNIIAADEFGSRRIDRIRYSDALLFLQKLQSNGRHYSSVQSVRGVLRPAFNMALKDQMIQSNPFAFELADALINDTVKREALSRENERKFLSFIKNDKHFCRYYDGIFILFNTGLRISEFCGLTVSSVDFKNHTLTVDHQLQRERSGKYVIVSPKTDAGNRVLPINREVEICFRRIINNRNAPAVEPIIDGYSKFLFYDKNGMPMVGMHWANYFKHIRNKYNSIYKVQMPLVTPHVCRHTFCTRMATSGVSPKTLQYLMGHSDTSVTMNVYTHLSFEDAQKELKTLQKNHAFDDTKNNGKVVNMFR